MGLGIRVDDRMGMSWCGESGGGAAQVQAHTGELECYEFTYQDRTLITPRIVNHGVSNIPPGPP